MAKKRNFEVDSYDGQRHCPKHVEFYSKNKFEKLVHLAGFDIRRFGRLAEIEMSYRCCKSNPDSSVVQPVS